MLRIFFIIFILFSFEVYANKLITGLLKGSSRGSNIQVWGYAGLKAFSENCLQGDQNSLLCQNNRFNFLYEYCESNLNSELCIDTEKFCFETIKTIPIKENEKLFTNPGGNFILQPGQVLIAFGSKEQLNILNGLLGNLVVAVELLK